jgi:hypothetical protein
LFIKVILYNNTHPCNHDRINLYLYCGHDSDVIFYCGSPESSRPFNNGFYPAVYSYRTLFGRIDEQH